MIQTVTGGIEKDDFGTILMHEHISCASLSFRQAFGEAWLNKEALKTLAGETLHKAREKYQLGLMIDGTPIDLGRDALLLKEVSLISGVKIIASTGFYYLPSIEALRNSPEELAEPLIYECQNGIDGTNIKPGILKCATGHMGINEDNFKKLSAMAIVQKETNLPLYIHCEHQGNIAFEQIALLQKKGANIEKLIIGHTAIRPDFDYLDRLLTQGCYISMDQCHCYPNNQASIAEVLIKLCQNGHKDKILLSNDYCIHSDFGNHSRNGFHLDASQHLEKLGYLYEDLFTAYISAGGNIADWRWMLCENPIHILDR